MSAKALRDHGYAITITDKAYRLVYDLNALVDLEDDHPDIMDGRMNYRLFKSPKYIRSMFAKGLAHHGLTEAETFALASSYAAEVGFVGLGLALSCGLVASFGADVDDKSGDDPENP